MMRFADKLDVLGTVLGANFLGLKRPLACHFSITNRCPWRCSYCAFKNLHKDECTTAEAIGIIDQLADLGNKRLHLVGGEPMVRKDVGQLITAAKKRGLYVTMATTGVHLRKHFDQVKDIDIFFLSFDGPREIHDAQRGQGAYDVLMEAMDVLSKNGKRFWTTTVITAKNQTHIDFILNTARERDFLTNFHLLYFTGTDQYLPGAMHLNQASDGLRADQSLYEKVLADLAGRKASPGSANIASSAVYFQTLQKWGDYSQVYRQSPSRYYKCWAGKLFCYIDANGDVYPCGDVMGRVRPRNAIELGLAKAFETLAPIPCKSCIVACYTELNLMFSLNLKSVLNWSGKV